VTFGNDSLLLGAAPTLSATLTALGDFDVDVLATVPVVHQHMFPDLPGNVRLIDSVPIGMFLRDCDLVIHHGGSGSSFSAVDAGRPQLVMAQPDGFDYGDAIERVGAGHLLEFAEQQRDSGVIAEHAGKILGQRSYRDAAEELARENTARPTPREVAGRLADHL
jgi:UDP:flavonoid glycosyltransferase YjiC (YdhE family)